MNNGDRAEMRKRVVDLNLRLVFVEQLRSPFFRATKQTITLHVPRSLLSTATIFSVLHGAYSGCMDQWSVQQHLVAIVVGGDCWCLPVFENGRVGRTRSAAAFR